MGYFKDLRLGHKHISLMSSHFATKRALEIISQFLLYVYVVFYFVPVRLFRFIFFPREEIVNL